MCESDRKRGGDLLKKIVKIALVIFIILISNFLILRNTVHALENQQIALQYLGQFNRILKYNGIPIKTGRYSRKT